MESHVTVEVMNKSLVKTAMEVMNTCKAEAENRVSLLLGEVGGDLNIGGKVKQGAKSSLNCANKTDINAAMKSALANAMKANSVAQTPSLLEGSLSIYSQSETNQKLINETVMETDLNVVNDACKIRPTCSRRSPKRCARC